MKDCNRHRKKEENGPEGPPAWPQATFTPDQRTMVRKGLRIWARVAIRSYMRKQEAGSQAEASGGEEERSEL